MQMFHRLGMLFCCIAVCASCATTSGIRSAPVEQGVSRTFQRDLTATLKAAQQSVVDVGLAVEEASEVKPGMWLIIAKKGASLASWGELVRVVVEETAPEVTQVRVLTQRRVATNVAAKGDYSSSILSNLDLKLR
jgi:hypothetical protein